MGVDYGTIAHEIAKIEHERDAAIACAEKTEAALDCGHPSDGPCGDKTFLCYKHLKAERDRLREAARRLVICVRHYRDSHDLRGAGNIETGRAWDAMRTRERELQDILNTA